MTTQTLLTVFLASPGDVAAERDIVVKVVEGFNKVIEAKGVRVEVKRWETDASPAWGKDGQAIINEQLIRGRDHDLFVVLFWNRFGTPTPRAKSGTVEELELAIKSHLRRRRPQIMLYFSEAPSTLKTKRELEQRQAVLDYRAGIKNGLYWTYKNKTEFRRVFHDHFGKWLMAEIEAIETKSRPARRRTVAEKGVVVPAKPKPRAKVGKAGVPPRKPILLGDEVFVAETVAETTRSWTVVIRSRGATDDRRIRALGGQGQWGRFDFAYELLAGTAQVVKAPERFDDGKDALWTVEIVFTPFGGNLASQLHFQGLNAAEIAQKKAEWLLLGLKPVVEESVRPWESTDNWATRQIIGSLKPIFPTVWKKVAGDKAAFKAAAALYAAHQLLKEGVCSHIDELTIRAIRGGKVAVSFRGMRPGFGGDKVVEIRVKGSCGLELSDR